MSPGAVVLDGVAAPPERGTAPSFRSAHAYCGQTAGWMKTPLGIADLGRGHIVLDGDPALPRERGTATPHLFAHVYCGHGRPSQTQLLLSFRLVCLNTNNFRQQLKRY